MSITKLNGVSSGSQRIIKGDKGDNYNIETYGSDHIINIPIASATNTGLLSNVDWLAFSSATSFTSNRPKTIIWVGEAITPVPPASRNGSVAYPFLTPQEAVDWAALQPESSFQVMVAPGTYGDLNVPGDKAFIFETSSTFYGAIIGNLTVNASPGPNNLIQFKNFAMSQIDYLGTPGDTAIVRLVYTCVVNGNVTNSGGVNAIFISAGVLDPYSGFSGCTIAGTVDLGITSQFSAANSDVQSSITAGSIKFVDSLIPNSVNAYGNNVQMYGSGFQIGTPVVTFLMGGGIVNFDSKTAINFGLNGGDIVGGEPFTQGAGPQLLRADSAFNPLDSVISTTPYHVTTSALAEDKDVIGIVYPSVASGGIALVWQSGESIPGVGLPTGTYYRYQLTGGYTSVPTTQQIGNGDGQNFFVNIQKTPSQQIMLSMLNPSGIWSPGEYVGPTAGSSSGPLLGFGSGVGFARIPKPGTLTNFKLTQASTSGTTVTNLQIFISPNGLPSLFFYSGVSLGVQAGDWISTDNVSTITVNEDDIISVYNNEFFGWTPDALTITADLLIN